MAAAASPVASLSPGEVDVLRNWAHAPFQNMEIHAELDHEIRLCMAGKEFASVLGGRGLGKSFSVQSILAKIEQEEVARALARPGVMPRKVLGYTTSAARGSKTSIMDLWRKAFQSAPPGRMLRQMSQTQIIDEIVERLRNRGFVLISIDEAHLINPANLDLLRQVPDEAQKLGSPLGLLLIGELGLRDSLSKIGQRGQRFATEICFTPLSHADFAEQWAGYHPHLPVLQQNLGGKEWNRLTRDMHLAAQGKFRRIRTLILNACAFSLALDRFFDRQIFDLAIEKLAPEE